MKQFSSVMALFCFFCHACIGIVLVAGDRQSIGPMRLSGLGLVVALAALMRTDDRSNGSTLRQSVSIYGWRSLAAFVLCLPANCWVAKYVYFGGRSVVPPPYRWLIDMTAIALEGVALWWLAVAPRYLRFRRMGTGRFGIPIWMLRDDGS